MMIRVLQPDGSTSLRPIDELPVTIGRGAESGIVLNDPNCSRTHAEIREVGGNVFIHDLKSLNGIRVNGVAVTEAQLKRGDIVSIGECELQYVSRAGKGASTSGDDDDVLVQPTGTGGVLEIIRAISLEGFRENRRAGEESWPGFLTTDPGAGTEHFKRLTAAYNNLMVIMNLVSTIGAHSHPRQVGEQFVAALRQGFPLVENVLVLEIGADDQLSVLFEERSREEDGDLERMTPSHTILRRVVEELRAVYAVDARRDPRFEKSESVTSRGVRSMMCAPLIARGEVIGVVYVDNLSSPYCFNHFDLNLLTVFAFHLAMALENSRLLSEVDRAFERAAATMKSVKQDKIALLLQYSQSEKKFRALFEQSALGAAVVNLDTRHIEEVNDGLVRMMGFTRRQFASMSFEALYEEGDRLQAIDWLRQVRRQGEGSCKTPLRTSRGEKLIALQSCRALRLGEGQVMVAYFIDITAKERAEEETKKQLLRITALSELSQALMTTFESADICRVLAEKVRALVPADLVAVALQASEKQPLKVVFRSRLMEDGTVRAAVDGPALAGDHSVVSHVLDNRAVLVLPPVKGHSLPDSVLAERRPLDLGESFPAPPAAMIVMPLLSRDRIHGVLFAQSRAHDALVESQLGTVAALCAQAALALSNARAFQSIREQEESLRQLSLQILDAQETERTRISRELHDGVGQQLTGMKYLLERIRVAAKSGESEKLMERIHEAADLAGQIIEDLRAISLDLRPTMLDDLGLAPTLDWFARQYTNRFGTQVKMLCDIGDGPLAPEIATSVFRIVQEALGNVAKHAKATRVEAEVRREAVRDRLLLTLTDNGVGFDLEALPAMRAARGCSGILNMKERAHFLGGEFDLESEPRRGTTIRITIPLKEAHT